MSSFTFGTGCSGTYFISGTAYSSDNSIIKNGTLTITIYKEPTIIETDSNGHYEIEIYWKNYCPSGRTRLQHKRDNKRINPQFVLIAFQEQEIKLKNNWRKYAVCFPKEKDKITWEKDLHFN